MTDDVILMTKTIPTVEPGTYPGTLGALETFSYGEGPDAKTLLRWTYFLDYPVDEHGIGMEVQGVSSLAMGPKAKAFGWVAVLIGRNPGKDDAFRQADLIGKRCLVTVILNDDGYSKVSTLVPEPKAPKAPLNPAYNPVFQDDPVPFQDAPQAPEPTPVGADPLPF